MSINSYKLVPVKMFEDILKNTHTPVEANRSIKSIIEDSEINTNNNNNIQNKDIEPKYSTPINPQMSTGGAQTTPLWVYEDQNTLPSYSQAKKVADSFESYKNVLDNDSIPDRIKVQLLQYLKDKYNKTRTAIEPSEDDDGVSDSVDPNYDGHNILLQSIMTAMGPEKRNKAKSIISFFLSNNNVIKWNSEGEFTLPKYADTSIINLASLMRILLYSNVGTEREIEEVIHIIRPFYKSIKDFIVNKKILNRLNIFQENIKNKYVSLNNTRKIPRNKKIKKK